MTFAFSCQNEGPVIRAAFVTLKKPLEESMRKILLTTAATIAIISSAGLFSGSANAVTQSSPSAVREAADSANLKQDVRWVCRWGYYGRRHCWWAPGYRYGWRHRHW
jgi:hypothetical protein